MKILFFINSLEGGGAERVTCTLATHFRAQGHDVVIALMHGGPIVYELPADVEVVVLEARRVLRGPGRLALLPVAALELARLIERVRPDVTISLLTRANLAHVMTRWFGNRRPIYISERAFPEANYGGTRFAVGALVRRLYPRATHIIAISEGVKASLGRMGVPLSKITTIYNPQDLDTIRAQAARAPTRPASARPFRMITAGRLVPSKGVPTLLAALAELVHRRGLDVQLVVLGDGPDGPMLRNKARELGLEGRVEWRGWVSELHAVTATCDVFAFASEHEAFGNVLVEAMACGLPVVSADCPSGPAEILDGGKYGYLVPVGDSGAIADAVQALATNPELHAEYKRRALERAQRFDVATIAQQYLQVVSPPAVLERSAAREPSIGAA